MKKIKPAKEYPRIPGRVTTDAVHRRFNYGKDPNKTQQGDAERQTLETDSYFCKQCNQELSDKEELKSHFETIKHNQYSSCVYCSKPVYVYKYKKNLEVYHVCRYG